jgi:2-methylcitrate dehydratase PrpD
MGVFRVTLAERMADFALRTSFHRIPSKAVVEAKRCILDCIGVTLAGSKDRTPLRRVLEGFISQIGGKPQCTVIGTRLKTAPPTAAFANGTFGHALDYDDINWIYQGHFSVALLPASLAIGELLDSSGKDVLTAYLVGLQVMCKLGYGMVQFGDHYKRGWHATGTIGTIGAAVSASKLLGLKRQQFVNAVGLAAGSAAGIRNNFGTLAKPFQAGQAAEKGVSAALLARGGMTSSDVAIEGTLGLCQASSTTYHMERIGEFSEPWGILHPTKGAIIKAYPAIGGGIGAIDAMISIANEYDLTPSQVKSIVCETADAGSLIRRLPKTGLEGKFSIQFWMALALIQRNIQLQDFSDEQVRSPSVVNLMRRVELKANHRIRPHPSVRISVRTTDGRSIRKRVWPPLGNPRNPMSETQLIQKFRSCAEYAASGIRQVEKVPDMVLRLEKLRSVRDLASNLNA